MTTPFLVLARAVHIGACLLFFGIFAFDRLVAAALAPLGTAATAAWWSVVVRRLGAVALALIMLSGLAWFALVAMNMSGQPLDGNILKIVWNQTQFGTVWKIRLLFWAAAVAGAGALQFVRTESDGRKSLVRLEFIFSALLLGSLAWAGHGTDGQPVAGHLLADVLHLLTAGLWPTGLLPFALLLRHLRRSTEPARWAAIAVLVRRFSALSLGSVSLLVATGFVNSWYLVGSWTNLIEQPYGRWLMVKIALFCAALGFGAVNLLRLKPRLLNEKHAAPDAGAAAHLQFNVWLEVTLGLLIVLVVAILGLLPPAVG